MLRAEAIHTAQGANASSGCQPRYTRAIASCEATPGSMLLAEAIFNTPHVLLGPVLLAEDIFTSKGPVLLADAIHITTGSFLLPEAIHIKQGPVLLAEVNHFATGPVLQAKAIFTTPGPMLWDEAIHIAQGANASSGCQPRYTRAIASG
ncbi:hypothetical protein ACER0C_031542 [Sarotherodon galilaeus]